VEDTAKGGGMDAIGRYPMLIGGDWVDADERFQTSTPPG
jgi:hypothetical protein